MSVIKSASSATLKKAPQKDVPDEPQLGYAATAKKPIAGSGAHSPTRRTVKKSAKKSKNDDRKRGPKAYPVITFEQSLVIARGIMTHAAGKAIRRVTLLEMMKLGPASDQSRNLITNSSKYGLTSGNYNALELKLTELGRGVVSPDSTHEQRARAMFEVAIHRIPAFDKLYEEYKGGRLPAQKVMQDALTDLHEGDRQQAVEVFVDNAKSVGLLITKDGSEHLLTIDQLVASPSIGVKPSVIAATATEGASTGATEATTTGEDFDKVCFFIAPIGDDGSDHRKHSDAVLHSFVEPALSESKLRVVRADKISKPGMISSQILEYILRSKLVIVDMSFHNPNVFYELCLRHVTGKPTVHLIREKERIPFDTGNFRTIEINMEDKYVILAKLETYRAEIANQIRETLANGITNDNPILAFKPGAKVLVD